MLKSPSLYIALLAVLKAGGAYVPVDVGLPAERADFMLRQADARLLLADEACRLQLSRVDVLRLNTAPDGWQFGGLSAGNLPGRSGPSDLAYCIFTSVLAGLPMHPAT
jgi:bacitracin synthase 2